MTNRRHSSSARPRRTRTPVAALLARGVAAAPCNDGNDLLNDQDLAGVTLVAEGSGVRAVTVGGDELPSHQAFWFAWSQFEPGTLVWTPLG